MKILNKKNIIFYKATVYTVVLLFIASCTSPHNGNKVTSKAIKDTISSKKTTKKKDKEKIEFINQTFLGNFQRNYYGDSLPENLNLNWKIYLGKGQTKVGKDTLTWYGAGWTGQPLLFKQDSMVYLLQGAFDHHLKKINAKSGKVVWQYDFDDVIKGTGTLWIDKQQKDSLALRYIVLQGARKGFEKSLWSSVVPSYRAISLISGKPIWKLNVWKTRSYSRDVDASALFYKDTAYIGLENGRFIQFLAGYKNIVKNKSLTHPKVLDTLNLYTWKDVKVHKGNLVTEASPVLLNNHIYLAAGSGHIYGYNLASNKIDWDYFTGSDIDGTPVATNDSCLLISIEKQYINDKGGLLKLNPKNNPDSALIWYYPVPNRKFATWLGGIIGSPAINDNYVKDSIPKIAAFTSIKGIFTVVEHTKIDPIHKALLFDGKTKVNKPKKLFSYYIGPSISSPIIIPPRILVAGYNGIFLFEYNSKMEFKLLAKKIGGFEATPFSYKGKIYIASRDGNLYCYGKKPKTKKSL